MKHGINLSKRLNYTRIYVHNASVINYVHVPCEIEFLVRFLELKALKLI